MGDIHRTRTTTRRDMVGRALLCVALGLTMGCGPDNDEPRGTTTPTPTDTASATQRTAVKRGDWRQRTDHDHHQFGQPRSGGRLRRPVRA